MVVLEERWVREKVIGVRSRRKWRRILSKGFWMQLGCDYECGDRNRASSGVVVVSTSRAESL